MGTPSGPDLSGPQACFDFAGGADNSKPSNLDRKPVAQRTGGGPPTKFARPSPGERIGSLTVLECEFGVLGAFLRARVQCDCGSAPYWSSYKSLLAPIKHTRGCRECLNKRRRKKPELEIGAVVGHLTVIDKGVRFKDRAAHYIMQCDCGSEPVWKTERDAYRGYQCCQHCWTTHAKPDRAGPDFRKANEKRMPPEIVPKAGDTIGPNRVLEVRLGTWGGVRSMLLQCFCGSKPRTVKRLAEFVNRGSKPCKSCVLEAATREWLAQENLSAFFPGDEIQQLKRLRSLHRNITERCTNPANTSYRNYGERGIRVHTLWLGNFPEFLRYIVTLQGWKDPTLEFDRENNNGNYEPDNVRFVTHEVNMGNRRAVAKMQDELNELRARLRALQSGTEELDS